MTTDYQTFIHLSRYSRWLEEEQRRETLEETVNRYMSTWEGKISKKVSDELTSSILSLKTMPSMRAMWASGPALERNNITGYNCSYLKVDTSRAFDEAMYILMCGTGVGFSVEALDVNKLPIVNDYFETSNRVIYIEDSKEGWAKALRKHIADLYLGRVHFFDYSRIRLAGAKLKTMGGRASGPEPLKELLEFTTNLFKKAAGRKLTPLECHDLMCKIGEVVVVGGVRRSAMISLSDLGDHAMQNAKSGQWWEGSAHRALANNSAVYLQKPDSLTFIKEWTALIESKSGERGIYSRYGAQKSAPARRDSDKIHGTNPCAEIALRSNQFCNLTEVVLRSDDTLNTIKDKIRIATIMGTLQSTLTNFPYLRNIWKTNTEEERLLGVSLTGICDCPAIINATEEEIRELRDYAVDINVEWAQKLDIPASTAITTVKPSGTVSQLVNSASGIHGRFAKHYIRTVRGDNKDPLTDFMKNSGVPSEPCFMKPDSTTIFSFPIESPEGSIMADDLSAIEQLQLWLKLKQNWAEHSVSITVYVKEDEWLEVGAWVYENFDHLTGVSFLPYAEHSYEQAPYQPVSETEYNAALSEFPSPINWNELSLYEQEDNTEGAQTLACTAGGCEI
jgi:ribonucleoside-triphosphate reductase